MIADDVAVRRLIYLEGNEVQALGSRNFRFYGKTAIAARRGVHARDARLSVNKVLLRKTITGIGASSKRRVCSPLVAADESVQVRAHYVVGTAG